MQRAQPRHTPSRRAASRPTPPACPRRARPRSSTLADGEAFDLRIAPVAKRIGDATVRMLAYNGSVPGPTLRVREGSEVVVNVVNEGDLEATVHWHGLRLENRYDGTHETQAPIPVGGSFTYRDRRSPTPASTGTTRTSARTTARSWACTGTSSSSRPTPTTGRRRTASSLLTLDDVLIEDGEIAPFGRRRRRTRRWAASATSCSSPARPTSRSSAQPRRGRPPLPDEHRQHPRLQRRAARRADEARRRRQRPLRARGARRVGDRRTVGARRRRRPVRAARRAGARAPHARARPTRSPRSRRRRAGRAALAEAVRGRSAATRSWPRERERLAPYLDAAPDKTLAFVAEMDLGAPDGPVVYGCPMHPEVVSEEPGSCPQCGMKLLATAAPRATSARCTRRSSATSRTTARSAA